MNYSFDFLFITGITATDIKLLLQSFLKVYSQTNIFVLIVSFTNDIYGYFV